jgi:hypothetical protein
MTDLHSSAPGGTHSRNATWEYYSPNGSGYPYDRDHPGYNDAQHYARNQHRAAARANLTCQHCGDPITATRADARYCSDGCRQAAYRTRAVR